MEARRLPLCSSQDFDHEITAIKSLRTKIRKDHTLRNDAHCQEAISAELLTPEIRTETSRVQAVVESRVQSSKILSQEIAKVIDGLKTVLGVTGAGNKGVDEEQESAESDGSDDGGDVDEDVGRQSARFEVVQPGSGSECESGGSWAGFEDTNDVEEDGDHKSSESDEEDPSDSEQDNSGSARSASSSLEPEPNPKRARAIAPNAKSQTNDSKASALAKAGKSTFLPSLSVGFIAGSDSDWSDAEVDAVDGPMKKNRRGQRARKA